LAVEKARAQQVATVALVDCSHTGRIGQFAEWAARRHMFAMIIGGGGYRQGPTVVPFGGAANILGTNPYAFALPGGRFGPIVVDFATSVTSAGKIAVHLAENKPIPEGWLLDKHGKPTTDPADFFDGGMQLPAAGHKGYGLALIAELIGEALLSFPPEYNWLVVAIDLGTFRPAADYAATAEAYLQKVKDVPPASGFDRVRLPGEPEVHTTRERERNGILVSKSLWAEIEEAAARLGVAVE
jgi:LDH2 family malate/lactate/ureidoglycolate dehydrogenase